jgi:hypothetical protein
LHGSCGEWTREQPQLWSPLPRFVTYAVPEAMLVRAHNTSNRKKNQLYYFNHGRRKLFWRG